MENRDEHFVFQMIFHIYYILVILLVHHGRALLGYDCETPYNKGFIVSLLEVGGCDSLEGNIVIDDVIVEVRQLPRLAVVEVLSCRIEIENIVEETTPGLSHGSKRYYSPINSTICMYVHAQRTLQIGNTSLDNLLEGVTNSRSIPSADPDKPNGSSHTFVHIVFKRYTVKLNLAINRIHLQTNTVCTYTDLGCTDDEGYQNYWSPIFHEGCKPLPQTVVYRGKAKRMQLPGYSTGYALLSKEMHVLLFTSMRHDACNTTIR